jgi:hypothetical protein
MTRRHLVPFCLAALVLVGTSPALAQYGYGRAPADPATGERYRVEVSGALWNPTPAILVSSESLGIPGTNIDFVADLGIVQRRFRELRAVVRPGLQHKLRLHYIPISYTSDTVLRRDIVFNGIRYSVGLPVQAQLTWNAWRFGYEYDFIYRDRGFAGFIVETKYTDVHASLVSPLTSEFARARAPIPAIGGIGRVYVAPNISITGEVTGFKLPERIDENYRGRFVDFDLYGTVNFTDHVGAQAGYRSFDVMYRIDDDAGSLTLKGMYFSGVLRF